MTNGVTTVNIDKIKELNEKFSNMQTSFSYTSYDTFKNGYINKCSDNYIKIMAEKLDSMYMDIQNSYKSIKTWWDDYICDFDNVNSSLQKETTLSHDVSTMISQLGNVVGEKLSMANVGGIKPVVSDSSDNPKIVNGVGVAGTTNTYLRAYEENPELVNAILIVMENNDTIKDFESCYKKCLEDEGYRNIIMRNLEIINEKKAEEQYAQDHPIKSSKAYKSCTNFFNGVKEVYFGTGENLFGMGLNLCNGVETGFQHLKSFFNYSFYELGLLDESDYLELQSEIKENEWFDDKIVDDYINNDTSLNYTKFSSSLNNIIGGMGETAIPLLATFAFGPIGGLVSGTMDGMGTGAYDATMHQKEYIDSQAIILNQDVESGTITYMYDGSKVTVDSTGKIICNEKICNAEYYDTLSQFHDMNATEKAATLQGIWGGFSWGIGSVLSMATLSAKPFVNSTIKIAIDSALGAAEVPVQSLIKAEYMRYYYDENGNMVEVDENATLGEKFKEAFDDNGGWSAVAQNAVMGGVMSTFGEISDLSKAKKYVDLYENNPTAFAENLIKNGFSEDEAIKMMNTFTKEELVTKSMKLDELVKSGNIDELNAEVKNIKNGLDGGNVDFTVADEIKTKISDIKDTISSMKDNANDTFASYKFKKEKGNDLYNEIISDINEKHLDYNVMKELEDMISNDSSKYYIGIHDTKLISSADNIYDNGLRLTGGTSSGATNGTYIEIGDLSSNINFSKNLYGNTRNILAASNYKSDGNTGYAMVVKIPKDVDFKDITYVKDGFTYLKPEYIVGEIEVKNGEIFSSPNTKFKNSNYKNVDIDASQTFASVAQKNNVDNLKTKMTQNASEIKKTIIETIEGQNIRVTDDIINKYVKEIEKGNYNVITRKNGARDRVIEAYINYKQLEKQISNPISKNNFDISSFKYSGKDVKKRKTLNGNVTEVYNTYSSPKYDFDICILENYDQSKSKYSRGGMYNELGRLFNECPELANKLKKIYLSSEVNPSNALMCTKYKMPVISIAESEGKGIISFFGGNCKEEWISSTLAHELGHELDRGADGALKYSTSVEWMNAINLDGKFVSDYAKRTVESIGSGMEDFADSVGTLYDLGKDKFKVQFPNRYEILKELLPSLCGGQ